MKRKILKITALLMAIIQLTACSSANNGKRSNHQTIANSSSDSKIIKEDVKVLEPIEVNLSSETVDKYSGLIGDITVEYYFEDMFNADKALEKYYSMTEWSEDRELKYISNGVIDEEKLKQRILENNEEYVNQADTSKYTCLSDSEFKEVFGILVDNLNTRLKNDIDIQQLDENLDRLTVMNGQIDANGLFNSEDGILVINMKLVGMNKDNPYYLPLLIKHESNHLVQSYSVPEMENEKYLHNMGVMYKWDDLELNTLGYQWFVEAGAEDLAQIDMNYNDDNIYKNKMEMLNGLKLASIYNPDVEVSTISELSLQGDLDKLFSAYNIETEAEKIEFINMFYTLELVVNNINYDFNEFYEKTTGERFNILSYETDFKCKCMETLSKLYYKNMLMSIENNEWDIEKIFDSIFLFEGYLNEETKIRSHSNTCQMDFMETYSKVQDLFFQALSENIDLSVDEIKELLNVYYDKKSDRVYSISGFSENKNNFLNNMYEKVEYFALKESIFSIYKKYLAEN